MKQICLYLPDVVASLRRALLVNALGVKTSWLDKPPHRFKVGFIEGVLLRIKERLLIKLYKLELNKNNSSVKFCHFIRFDIVYKTFVDLFSTQLFLGII